MTTSTYIHAKRASYIEPSFKQLQTEASVIQSFNIDTNTNSISLMMTKEQYVDFLISLGKVLSQEIDKHRFQEGLQVAEQS